MKKKQNMLIFHWTSDTGAGLASRFVTRITKYCFFFIQVVVAFLKILILLKEFHHFLSRINSRWWLILDFTKELQYFLATARAVQIACLAAPRTGRAREHGDFVFAHFLDNINIFEH